MTIHLYIYDWVTKYGTKAPLNTWPVYVFLTVVYLHLMVYFKITYRETETKVKNCQCCAPLDEECATSECLIHHKQWDGIQWKHEKPDSKRD